MGLKKRFILLILIKFIHISMLLSDFYVQLCKFASLQVISAISITITPAKAKIYLLKLQSFIISKTVVARDNYFFTRFQSF